MPRPTKLTTKTQDKIVQAIRAGNFLSTAAAFAGVSESILYSWLAEGRKEGAPQNKAEFSDAVTQARADMEVRVVANVMRDIQGGYVRSRRIRVLRDGTEQIEEDIAGPNGALGLKVLTAAFPSRWAGRQQIELTGADGGPVHIETGDREKVLAQRLADFIAEQSVATPELERATAQRLDSP